MAKHALALNCFVVSSYRDSASATRALQEREWVGTPRHDRVPLIRDTSARIRGNGVCSDPRQTAAPRSRWQSPVAGADAPWNSGTPNRDPLETLKSPNMLVVNA